MRKIGLNALVFLWALFLVVDLAWAQDYSFTYTCDNQGKVMHPDSLGGFITVLRNTGAQADTYRVVMAKDLPGIWQSIACLPWGCFFDSANVSIAAAQQETITVDIMPLGTTGVGTVTMRVRSFGDPLQTAAIPLTAITNIGVDILVVDDDGTQDYETYYEAALDSTDLTYGTFDLSTTIVDTSELLPFSAVVWFTGEATPVLTERDRLAISGYLESGGRLFISGQDIAYALNDSASGEADSASVAWFEDTFYTQYLGDDSDTLILEGIPGDPISNGLTLSISGGDGAGNQTSPDALAGNPPYPIFHYPGLLPPAGAVKVSTGVYKLVYFAFGFEAINNAADRVLVMDRVIDWLFNPTSVEHHEEIASQPVAFSLSPNYPNPFNATTTFSLIISGQKSTPITLYIYNVLGQEVRTLVDGIMSPGSYLVVWDGKDNLGQNLASGVYFSRLQAGKFSQTRKLVLAR